MPMRSLSAWIWSTASGSIAEHCGRRLEDGDPDAGAGIDMAELEGDHAAADEHDVARQRTFAQHVIRGDHQFRAGNAQRPWP